MAEEFVELQEEGGDTAEMQVTAVSGGETETILVVLTTVFLIIATVLVALKLHISYDFLKDQEKQAEQEKKIKDKYKD